MTQEIQIHYRGLPPSDAVTARIQQHFDRLRHTFRRQSILGARCHLELLNHRNGRAGCYRTTLDLALPGRHVVVGRDGGRHGTHQDAYEALAEAFEAMERRLRDYAQVLRHEVKHKGPGSCDGRVVRLFPQEGYGFLATPEGREVYFDQNAVLSPGFERLEVGSPVRFCEEAGDEGPQASTVHPH